MDDKKLIKQIVSNAQVINEMTNNIHETFKKKDENEQAWHDACKKFHSSYDSLAFPGGLDNAIALLREQDPSIVPIAITYLKADPYFFRSGFIKGKIVSQLKKFTFNEEQIKELQDIIIDTIFKLSRREFKDYYRLAIHISDNNFLARIQEILKQSHDPVILKHAQYLFDLLQTHSK